MSFFDFDYLLRFKDMEVPAQIAIGQRAKLLEIIEEETLRMGDERCKNAETGALMNDSVEAFVGETTFARRSFSLHVRPPA